MNSDTAMLMLRASPVSFLQQYRFLYVGNPGATQITTHNLFGPTQADYCGEPEFHLTAGAEPDFFRLPPYLCNVFAVKMLNASEVDFGSLPAIPLPRMYNDSDVSLACTGMLSGCSIVMQRGVENTGPFLAHIRPDRGLNGLALQEALAEARFENSDAPVEIYGAHQYNPDFTDGRASIVGVLEDGRWTVYTQQYRLMSDDQHLVLGPRFYLGPDRNWNADGWPTLPPIR